jgi:hypothetical protein
MFSVVNDDLRDQPQRPNLPSPEMADVHHVNRVDNSPSTIDGAESRCR